MKPNYVKYIIIFTIIFLFIVINPVKADLPLNGKVIVLDAGHGGVDPGTVYQKIYEKDINLSIVSYLKEYLIDYGATVILTRESDSDLSNGVKNHRKKADFDNRIKIINNSNADIYLSIHLNHLANTKYYGAQVFYNKNNMELAVSIQHYLNKYINSNRKVKKIPSSTYMYNKINTNGLLIECGFLSNSDERKKLITTEYQKFFAKILSEAILNYYK